MFPKWYKPVRPRFDFAEMVRETGAIFDLTPVEVLGSARRKKHALARMAIYHFLRERGLSLHRIGQMVGGRHHTTILESLTYLDSYRRHFPLLDRAITEGEKKWL